MLLFFSSDGYNFNYTDDHFRPIPGNVKQRQATSTGALRHLYHGLSPGSQPYYECKSCESPYWIKINHLCAKYFHDGDVKWKHFHVTGPLWRESTCGFPPQRPVTQSFDVFFDLRLTKRLSKQSRRWWFEIPLHSLWRHCYVRRNINTCVCMFCHSSTLTWHGYLESFSMEN